MKNLKIIFTQIKDFIVSKWKIITYIICSLIILSFVVLAFKLLTNPMNTKVTRKNYDNVIERIRKNSSKDDYQKVQAVIAMAELASLGDNEDKIDYLEGKSFNQMIKRIQKNLEEENKEAEQQKIISAEKQKIRDEYLKFDNYTWEVKTSNYQSNLIITAEIENLKDIDIEAFEGIISISDKLDNNLGDFKIKNTKIIPKKAKADIDMTFYEDEYYSEIKVISRQSGDLYFSFTPTKLIVDGNEI